MKNDKTGQLLSNNVSGVNRILPHKHKYAWDLFLKGCANNWMPTEISMQNDIKQWKNNEISEDEKLLVKRCLGFFAGSESLVGNNLLLSAFRYVTDAECRQYILRQAFEESLHNLTIVYICDSLDLDIDEVFKS
jgi:ribonucleoside-diphosphate reductase beta chain